MFIMLVQSNSDRPTDVSTVPEKINHNFKKRTLLWFSEHDTEDRSIILRTKCIVTHPRKFWGYTLTPHACIQPKSHAPASFSVERP